MALKETHISAHLFVTDALSEADKLLPDSVVYLMLRATYVFELKKLNDP